MRLDIAVVENNPDINRSKAQQLIKSKSVEVNGKLVITPSRKVGEDDKIKIIGKKTPPQRKFRVEILYEGDEYIVIDKPLGMLSHSKGADTSEQTVASWLSDYLGLTPRTNRDLIVHRLDRSTSGVMICAKNEECLKRLQKEFSNRKVKKHYVALVQEEPKPDEAIIDAPIERDPKKPSRFRVAENGKQASTHYKVLKRLDAKKPVSMIDLYPHTGRTHQLRVHMKYIDHQIIGDEIYGGYPAERLYLHAKSLKIRVGHNQIKEFFSELPADFNDPKLK
jgi:23S rRNA pseudouridine1911/1915/1917 synthase